MKYAEVLCNVYSRIWQIDIILVVDKQYVDSLKLDRKLASFDAHVN